MSRMLSLTFSFFIVFSLFLTPVVLAQDDITTDRAVRADARRAEFEARRAEAVDKAEIRRAEMQDKVEQIRDENKQILVERLNEKLNKFNARWTEHWINVLNRLSELLDKVESRANRIENNGGNVTEVRAAIVDARAAIELALVAVNEQASKVYTPEITDEQTVGVAVRAAIAELREDLRLVRETVRFARESVVSAVRLLNASNE